MDFWDVFWLLLIFIPLLLIWGFAIVDIFRRDDLSGWLKALWVVVVILLPFLGTLIYLIFRQPGATPQERQAMDQASREFVEKYSPSDSAQQLRLLSDLHDRGKLTDVEFAEEKTRLLDAARAHGAASGSGPTTARPDRDTTDAAGALSTRPDRGETAAGVTPPTRPDPGSATGMGTPPTGPGTPSAGPGGPAAPSENGGASEPPRRPRGFGA
ncbi:hypothetical protein Cme02nite_41330 [Catellatospora methionotrophica]|uniref:Cardiolipin synthase N-terminal domain-containing protein n=1 Tax=Catellatospora methionotrophica TaxID=121620 RepID=A0A8J3LIJ0_9ACTN|nr:SHOCT domain-containing protein [Catellatospora methionotrophica]GIG15801.1 hypothetical protein Cme02nite_41330 [Catellatospora methionotrophica]